ncbi:MAG: diguanylate cyclase, partial [Nitrospirae bacterium]|nr:diguanylate cyclase [Nitrospirota bacterium]
KFVIADWMMPVLDGVELCRKIRLMNEAGYIYFILLTGKDKKEDVVQGLDSGADDYITKPFEREELRVRVMTGMRILELEKRLEELACIDPLMQIRNRRYFHQAIERIHDRARRYSEGYGVIMCDIDYFKKYNDIYGHIQGDNILKTIAETLKETLRLSDEIFRYGGEEIIIILPEQEINDTTIAAERIVRSVESLRIEHKGSEFSIVTISCGIAAFDKKTDLNSKWISVVDRADKALYRAKSGGRNRVSA